MHSGCPLERCAPRLTTVRRVDTCLYHQAGVALLTVLLIVFLASVAAVSLASIQQLAIRRSTLLLHQQQARLYTLGAEKWAAAILKRDLQANSAANPATTPATTPAANPATNVNNKDDLTEEWANLPPALPVEGGSISGRIEDLQGRFNLNNLINRQSSLPPPPGESEQNENSDQGNDNTGKDKSKRNNDNKKPAKDVNKGKDIQGITSTKQSSEQLNAQLELFTHLLEVLELNTDIAQAIVDWIDQDQEARFPDGAEDSEYAVRTPPYLTANQPFASVSELRLIKSIDKATYDKLAPYVCTLPPGTSINVNTIVAPLLIALGRMAPGSSLDPENAKTLLEFLKTQGHDNKEKFLEEAGLKQLNQFINEKLGVTSNYFLLHVEAQVGDGRATLYSMLERANDGRTRVLMRSFGNEN